MKDCYIPIMRDLKVAHNMQHMVRHPLAKVLQIPAAVQDAVTVSRQIDRGIKGEKNVLRESKE